MYGYTKFDAQQVIYNKLCSNDGLVHIIDYDKGRHFAAFGKANYPYEIISVDEEVFGEIHISLRSRDIDYFKLRNKLRAEKLTYKESKRQILKTPIKELKVIIGSVWPNSGLLEESKFNEFVDKAYGIAKLLAEYYKTNKM